MKEKHSAGFLRQRKMMMILPALVLPFITMAFWALGGGQGPENKSDLASKGLNLQLPDANFKEDKDADKLSFYKLADIDSVKKEERLRNDPYYKDSVEGKENILSPVSDKFNSTQSPYSGLNYSPYNKSADVNEQKVYQKINELNKQINQPDNVSASRTNSSKLEQPIENNEQFSTEVDKLQGMMQLMNDKQGADPEMQQLNGTLEKILDIQHPERVNQKLQEKSIKNKELVFIVSKEKPLSNISLLDTGKIKAAINNGFFSIDEEAVSEVQNTIEAVVHQTQTLVNGAVVKMRLLNAIYINGALVPKDNFVYGTAQLNNERLEIAVSSIRSNKSLFPVKLEVFDLDGLPGIYIPGAIARDVAKQSADNGLQLMELSAMDPSLKAQAATSGINAAKSLFSKKIKLVKVVVKAGYKVLLKDKYVQQ